MGRGKRLAKREERAYQNEGKRQLFSNTWGTISKGLLSWNVGGERIGIWDEVARKLRGGRGRTLYTHLGVVAAVVLAPEFVPTMPPITLTAKINHRRQYPHCCHMAFPSALGSEQGTV